MSLKEFADTLPEYAKDLRLNLSSILNDQLLGEDVEAHLARDEHLEQGSELEHASGPPGTDEQSRSRM